jgi:hypothetical protein
LEISAGEPMARSQPDSAPIKLILWNIAERFWSATASHCRVGFCEKVFVETWQKDGLLRLVAPADLETL